MQEVTMSHQDAAPAMAPANAREVNCPLCGQDKGSEVYRSSNPFMRIVACAHCSMMYQNPQVPEIEMEDSHEQIGGYARMEEQSAAKVALFRERIRRFRSEYNLPERGRFLDVGCARGAMLDAMHVELPGWELTGIETSPSATAASRAKGFRVVGGASQLAGERFDWINIDNVLEHVPGPKQALSELRGLLAPAGFIYVDVPNESMLGFRYRVNDIIRGYPKLPTAIGHINLFTKKTLRQVAEGAGLRCEESWLESVSVPNRLFAALGADETPRVSMVFKFLRATLLDVRLGLAYFVCARLTNRA